MKPTKFTLKRVAVYYPKVYQPVPTYDGDAYEWTIDVEPSQSHIQKLTKLGSQKKLSKNGTIKFKKAYRSKSGEINNAPLVVGPDMQPFTDYIGNESVCNVRVVLIEYKPGKCATILDAVQVIDHVPYEPKLDTSGFEMVEDNEGEI